MNPFIAQIIMFGGNFAPRGWAFCEGQLLAIAQYNSLFSLLGTTYGGDGRTTFGLPDLRGRAPMGTGNGPGLTPRLLGHKNGSETNTLNITQLPNHSHTASGTVMASNLDGTTNDPSDAVPAKATTALDRSNIVDTNSYNNSPDTQMASNSVNITVGNTGGSQSVNNMQPSIAISYIIALEGVYPSRS